jgi:phage baseplate assembly protein W
MFERTYGIDFPFRDSRFGTYLRLTETADQEIRASLLHLILTRKGSRYYLPEFGTRLYEFIFEPFDNITFAAIESDIRDSVEKFLPNLTITNISVEPAEKELENPDFTTNPEEFSNDSRDKIYRVPGKGTTEYTAKVRIDYSITNNVFSQSDFVIINL